MLDIESLEDQSERYWSLVSHFHSTNMFHIEPTVTQELTDRAVKNLDASYKAVDLPTVVKNNCEHLTRADKSKLLELLTEFKKFSDGTLGDWKRSPVGLELQQNYSHWQGLPDSKNPPGRLP